MEPQPRWSSRGDRLTLTFTWVLQRLSNAEWESLTDPEARIAKLKDNRTHLAYKPEHAVDLDIGAVVVTDRRRPWKTHIVELKRDGFLHWRGDGGARRAVVNNRTRLLSGVARVAFQLRAEIVERGFVLILDRGMLQTQLRGRKNIHKRYLIHVAGYNLGLIMRLVTGAAMPRELAARASVWIDTILMSDGRLTPFSCWRSGIRPPSSSSAPRQTRSVKKLYTE